MKKLLSIMLMLTVVFTSIFAFGCVKESDVVGTWSLAKGEVITTDGDASSISASELGVMRIEFKEDKTFSISVKIIIEAETEAGEWKIKGKDIIMTVDGEDETATIDKDGYLVMEESDDDYGTVRYYFKKAA